MTGAVGRAANIPIALNSGSYNFNTVVTAGTPGSSATFTGGTPAAVDTENGITFWGPSYNVSGALPTDATAFTSSGNSATQFKFASFTGNNTLLINADQAYSKSAIPPFYAPSYQQTGSLTLASPGAYSTLAVLYSAAGQNYYSQVPSINYTLNFADGTTYNASGTASFTGYGWHDSRGVVAATGYRVWVNPTTNTGKTSGTTWDLHEADITVPTADVNEVLTGISFYDSGSGYYGNSSTWANDPNSLAVYALSGSATPAVPEPVTGGFIAAAFAAARLRPRRRTDLSGHANRTL